MKKSEKLPLPRLEEVLDLFKVWVNPLLNESENIELLQIIEKFKNSDGKELDKKLKGYISQLEDKDNWLFKYWQNMYLSIRSSLLTESNYTLHLTPFCTDKYKDSLAYIAQWFRKTAIYYKKNLINPEEFITIGEQEFSLYNAHNLLGCTRRVKEKIDEWIKYPELLKNIAVIYHNHYYIVPLFDDDNNIYSLESVKQMLVDIKNYERDEVDQTLISRIHYLGSEIGAKVLGDINHSKEIDVLEKTIFHAWLKDDDFSENKQLFDDILANSALPLWACKPVNFVFWNNNQISLYMEHTGADATYMIHNIEKIKESFSSEDTNINTNKALIEPLNITYTAKEKDILHNLEKEYSKNISKYKLKSFDIKYSSEILLNCSPNSLAQLTLQYSMHKILNGNYQATYEACAMNQFIKGRTEAIFTISTEANEFIKNLNKGNFSKELFNASMNEDKNRIKIAKSGHSFHRYLTMLNFMRQNDTEASYFFNSIAWQKINKTYFSTSNVGKIGNTIDYFYFIPPKPAHFGIGYQTNRGYLRFNVVYYEEEIEKMIILENSLKEFFSICDK